MNMTTAAIQGKSITYDPALTYSLPIRDGDDGELSAVELEHVERFIDMIGQHPQKEEYVRELLQDFQHFEEILLPESDDLKNLRNTKSMLEGMIGN